MKSAFDSGCLFKFRVDRDAGLSQCASSMSVCSVGPGMKGDADPLAHSLSPAP